MITHKEHIIKYFESGIKGIKDFKIGIEHEKFLFDEKTNRRVYYPTVLKMFSLLSEFGWKPIMEKENIIGLQKQGKSITLEPGNQIELSGDKLNNIHEACAESHDYLFELQQVTKKLNLKIVSAGFDPISSLSEVPNNPKQRYQVMTKDMPNGGSLSLDMMYRTCGTQLNLDYDSEKDFIKKFKIINSIVPISIALFANSSIVEKKNSGYSSYRSKVWQETSRGGLPEVFFDKETRFDFLVEKNKQKIFVEVKNVTLFREEKTAEFPDAVTTRGSKHLKTLIEAVKNGYKSYLLFLVQIQGVDNFKIAKDIDKEYYENYLLAKKAGVIFLAYQCKISSKEIKIDKKIKIINA